MIHYHGTPITPDSAGVAALTGGHAFVSFRRPDQLGLVATVCQSFAVDNGAFSAWKAGQEVKDWSGYYTWAEQCRLIPSCDFAIIPDVIAGSEADNDTLLAEWPLPRWYGAPVWHMHEGFERLERLASEYPRVCLGSSGEYSTVGSQAWWGRMSAAMGMLCDAKGRPPCKLHGLRMLNPRVFSKLPLSSADSTNLGRNIGIDMNWKGTYTPPTKEVRAAVLRSRIESTNSPNTWSPNTDTL